MVFRGDAKKVIIREPDGFEWDIDDPDPFAGRTRVFNIRGIEITVEGDISVREDRSSDSWGYDYTMGCSTCKRMCRVHSDGDDDLGEPTMVEVKKILEAMAVKLLEEPHPHKIVIKEADNASTS